MVAKNALVSGFSPGSGRTENKIEGTWVFKAGKDYGITWHSSLIYWHFFSISNAFYSTKQAILSISLPLDDSTQKQNPFAKDETL